MNAALGFDSFVVMRHGVKRSFSDEAVASPAAGGDDGVGGAQAGAGARSNAFVKVIPGNQLGCYFCNDVVGPGGNLFSLWFTIFDSNRNVRVLSFFRMLQLIRSSAQVFSRCISDIALLFYARHTRSTVAPRYPRASYLR